jgi:hypothetical protein
MGSEGWLRVAAWEGGDGGEELCAGAFSVEDAQEVGVVDAETFGGGTEAPPFCMESGDGISAGAGFRAWHVWRFG